MQQHNFDVDIVIPSSQQKVKINKDSISVNQTTIACADVAAVKYGVSLVGGEKNPQFKRYIIDVKSKDGKTVSIQFQSSKVEELLAEDHTYYYIMTGFWQHVKKHVVEGFIQKLNDKEEFEVAGTKFTNQGVGLSYKTWFFGKTKTEIVPWGSLKYHQDKGVLTVASTNNSKQKVAFSYHDDWNAVVLNTLMHYLWQDHRREKLAKGETI